jgi:hypothetical protein
MRLVCNGSIGALAACGRRSAFAVRKHWQLVIRFYKEIAYETAPKDYKTCHPNHRMFRYVAKLGNAR